MIKQCGTKWCLYTKDGKKVLGRHKTRQGAEAQEKAIMANMHGKPKSTVLRS
jgi:hypothetical protein